MAHFTHSNPIRTTPPPPEQLFTSLRDSAGKRRAVPRPLWDSAAGWTAAVPSGPCGNRGCGRGPGGRGSRRDQRRGDWPRLHPLRSRRRTHAGGAARSCPWAEGVSLRAGGAAGGGAGPGVGRAGSARGGGAGRSAWLLPPPTGRARTLRASCAAARAGPVLPWRRPHSRRPEPSSARGAPTGLRGRWGWPGFCAARAPGAAGPARPGLGSASQPEFRAPREARPGLRLRADRKCSPLAPPRRRVAEAGAHAALPGPVRSAELVPPALRDRDRDPTLTPRPVHSPAVSGGAPSVRHSSSPGSPLPLWAGPPRGEQPGDPAGSWARFGRSARDTRATS